MCPHCTQDNSGVSNSLCYMAFPALSELMAAYLSCLLFFFVLVFYLPPHHAQFLINIKCEGLKDSPPQIHPSGPFSFVMSLLRGHLLNQVFSILTTYLRSFPLEVTLCNVSVLYSLQHTPQTINTLFLNLNRLISLHQKIGSSRARVSVFHHFCLHLRISGREEKE